MIQNLIYTTFPHTADLGVEVYGADLPALFEHSAIALFDLMTDSKNIKAIETVEFAIQADDRELLLREWLGELLYFSISHHFLFNSFQIIELSDTALKANAGGESYNSHKHYLKREIKSVTYHQLKIINQNNNWTAQFVLDI